MNELPSIVLDKVFSFCGTPTLVVIPTVCKHWQEVFSHSVVALPALKLWGPLRDIWLGRHADRVVEVTLKRVEELDRVSWLKNLKSLAVEECRRLEDLSPLAHLSQLQKFTIRSCRSIRDLSPLIDNTKLCILTIDRCWVRDLTPLSGHPSLQEIHLAYDCWSVMHLCLPDSLPALRRMRIMSAIQELEVYCVSLYDLSALSALTELRELDLHTLQEANCLHTDSLSPLSSLTKLRALGLQGSDASIVDACPWHSMTGLTRVDLHGSCVSDLAPLRRLAGLHALDLTEARELVDLQPLSGLMNLSELVLTGCRRVTDLTPVMHLVSLGGLKRP